MYETLRPYVCASARRYAAGPVFSAEDLQSEAWIVWRHVSEVYVREREDRLVRIFLRSLRRRLLWLAKRESRRTEKERTWALSLSRPGEETPDLSEALSRMPPARLQTVRDLVAGREVSYRDRSLARRALSEVLA